MSKRYMITFSDEQDSALEKMMSEDLSANKSGYLAALIGAEAKRRDENKNRRPAGRPRKSASVDAADDEYEDVPDYSHDVPKNIPHFGRMIGAREMADIENTSGDFKPQSK